MNLPTLDLPVPDLRFFADLSVEVAAPQDVGDVPAGRRRVIPITGGQVRGEGWTGRVLGGGADYQVVVGETLAELDARYVIETDAGELIYVCNQARRAASAEVTARLMRGDAVDPALVYFRCWPRLECASARLAWVNERLFLGTGARRPGRVELRFFVVE
ncbi:MAG TPA: DUF3237 domain-containing protein [Burkholderiaceae bacterium]|nr:DUF3237 domain-containing protein [Burkholderiaceae bacterium]